MPHKSGRIVISETASVACSIVEKTDTGAKLKLPIGVAVPDAFELIEVSTGESYDATVTWKRYPQVGVSFPPRVYL